MRENEKHLTGGRQVSKQVGGWFDEEISFLPHKLS